MFVNESNEERIPTPDEVRDLLDDPAFTALLTPEQYLRLVDPSERERLFGQPALDDIEKALVPLSSADPRHARRCSGYYSNEQASETRSERCTSLAEWYFDDRPLCLDHASELRRNGTVSLSRWVGDTDEQDLAAMPQFFDAAPLRRVANLAAERRAEMKDSRL